MTSDMSALLSEARAEAEALMVDICTIQHQTGSTLYDNGSESPTFAQAYVGKCRVQLRGGGSQSLRDVGDQQVALLTVEVQLPMWVTGLAVRDLVTIVASEFDADLTGRTFRVADLMHKTHATARRLQCVEVTA